MAQKNNILYDFLIRHAWHRISRMYNQKASEHNMTMSIGFILMIVDKDGTPSTQLGPRMGMEPTSLSRTLKTMEDRNLIRRQEDKIDKRKVFIFLTAEGLEYRRLVRETILEFNEKIHNKVSQDKLDVFYEVLNHMDQLVEEELKINSKK
ncbi:MAG: MarR family winged helix-turn-helix transcriptional regulator [Flavobacteriia bacterium]